LNEQGVAAAHVSTAPDFERDETIDCFDEGGGSGEIAIKCGFLSGRT